QESGIPLAANLEMAELRTALSNQIQFNKQSALLVYLLFVYSFIRLFGYSFIRLFVYSFIRLFVYSFIRLFVYSFICLFVYLFICLFVYSFIILFTYSFNISFVKREREKERRCLDTMFMTTILFCNID